jgi:hypothetical protein
MMQAHDVKPFDPGGQRALERQRRGITRGGLHRLMERLRLHPERVLRKNIL